MIAVEPGRMPAASSFALRTTPTGPDRATAPEADTSGADPSGADTPEADVPAADDPGPGRPGSAAACGWRRWVVGDGPWWARPGLAVLLAATAVLYLWSLGSSGWANAFYSAAAQAGSQSWRAWFFGASDAPGLIMVDKPPAALWVMGLSARLFGVNAWSILVPQALLGVAAVGVLHAAVRRWACPAAGLLAGAALALTPVATLMFRFNNPDALLVLLLVTASWAVVRAVDASTLRRAGGWLALAGFLVGCGFLTKSLQAFLVLPALTLVFLVAGPGRLRGRLVTLLPATAVLAVASGWWVAVVDLWPAAERPYVGGSQTNSALELLLGYNGFGRVTGNEVGSLGGGGRGGGPGGGGPGGGGPGGGFGGGGRSSGSALQLLSGEMASQVSWLLPAAVILAVAVLVLGRRAPRTDRARAAVLLWGGSLLVTAAVFTLSRGIIHPYYAVALAPGIAALVGVGTVVAARSGRAGLVVLSGTSLVGALWAWALLRETPTFVPWLRVVVLVGGLASALALALSAARGRRSAAGVVATVGLAALLGLAGPAASSVATAATPHAGALPSAGPGGSGPGGHGGPGHGGPGHGGPGGAPPGGGRGPGHGAGAHGSGPGRGGPGGGPGGGGMALLEASRPGPELTALLRAGAPGHTWVAAAVGSNAAAGYQLASGAPVMALGGFNGTDPAPTLAQFQADVAAGTVHYFVGTSGAGTGRAEGGSDDATRIAAWVAAHFPARQVDGTTVYDLTAGR